ncbi:MAG: DUF481 domain-containing protein [Candidatus Kapabacteria bacterium]|nr:DUF481 domain-containing protein [Candidatus Kapabacteria bacterium]
MRFSLLVLSIVTSTNVSAQLFRSDTARWSAALNGSMSLNFGNVDRVLLFGSADGQHVGDVLGIKNRSTWQYGFFGTRTTDSEINSRTVLYLYPKDAWYTFATYWYTHSLQRGLDSRSLASIGLTRVLVHDSTDLVKISLSAAYEYSNYRGMAFVARPDINDDRIVSPRVVGWLYGAHDVGTAPITIEYECWLAPSVSDINNVRFYGTGSIRWPLSRHIALTLTSVASWESVVVVGRKPTDVLFLFGLTVRV